jgi:ATP-dependent DNA helicase DinG
MASSLHERSQTKNFFGKDSPLKLHLKSFEERNEQTLMAQDIEEALTQDKMALIEAGTGIGKSLAYLIPAILWAQEHDERIVISTNTIALQEQLIEKDIPLALKVTGAEMKAVLVKGMGNYVCIRKLTDAINTGSLFALDEQEELQRIDTWCKSSPSGSRSDIPFFPSYSSWEKVAVEQDACSHAQCPNFNECFLFKARKEAQEAKILIVNHHLLFADIAIKREFENNSTPAILPVYTRLIIDEAHHVEDVAQEYFAERVSRFGLMKVIAQLGLEKGEKSHSKLGILHQKVISLIEKDSTRRTRSELEILHKIEQELGQARRECLHEIQQTFDTLSSFLTLFPKMRDEGDPINSNQSVKLRLKQTHFAHPFWQKTIVPFLQNISKTLMHLASILFTIDRSVIDLGNDKLEDATKSVRVDIKALESRLETMATRLQRFIHVENDAEKIYWIEHYLVGGHPEVELVFAQQDISELLKKSLF